MAGTANLKFLFNAKCTQIKHIFDLTSSFFWCSGNLMSSKSAFVPARFPISQWRGVLFDSQTVAITPASAALATLEANELLIGQDDNYNEFEWSHVA